jgi:hypothetical protein
MIVSQDIQHFKQKNIMEEMSMFQTACSDTLRQEVMAVRCDALRRRIYLLSQPLSSHAEQTVADEPFTSAIQTAVSLFFIFSTSGLHG